MAKIGLNNFRYSILESQTAEGVPTYSGHKAPGKAVSCSVEVSNNEAELYADDQLQESDKSFQKATVTMGIDRADITTMAEILGHKNDPEKGLVRNANDIAPYVGLGRVISKLIDGIPTYTVEFLYKVKFAEPSQEENTKGESVEFSTYELEGTASTLNNGDWSITKDFTTKAEAITYLEGLMAGA